MGTPIIIPILTRTTQVRFRVITIPRRRRLLLTDSSNSSTQGAPSLRRQAAHSQARCLQRERQEVVEPEAWNWERTMEAWNVMRNVVGGQVAACSSKLTVASQGETFRFLLLLPPSSLTELSLLLCLPLPCNKQPTPPRDTTMASGRFRYRQRIRQGKVRACVRCQNTADASFYRRAQMHVQEGDPREPVGVAIEAGD
jgi:hypothetical protein